MPKYLKSMVKELLWAENGKLQLFRDSQSLPKRKLARFLDPNGSIPSR